MRARVAVGLVLLGLVAAVASAAPGSAAKAVATESLSATGLAITPRIAYERATLRVRGPEGYSGRMQFEAGVPIEVDLLALGQRSAGSRNQRPAAPGVVDGEPAMPDGGYKFEVVFASKDQTRAVHSGMFFVEGGVAVSRGSKRAQLAQVRRDLSRDRQQVAARAYSPRMSTDRSGFGVLRERSEAPQSKEPPSPNGYGLGDFLYIYPSAYPFSWLGLGAYDYVMAQSEAMSISNYAGDIRIADYWYPSVFSPYIRDLAAFTREGDVGVGTASPIYGLDVYYPSYNRQFGIVGWGGYQTSVGVGSSGWWIYDNDFEPVASFNHAADPFTLVVDAEGVGVGEFYYYPYYPAADLHVRDEDPQLLVESTSGTTTGRTLAYMKNNGDVRMFWENTGSGDLWQMSLLSTVLQMASPTGSGKFRVRKSGGLQALNGSTEIMALTATGDLTVKSVTETSSREEKRGFEEVNGLSVLERVAALPIREWSYKADSPSVRHLGPMAEDFHAAFGLGKTDKGITSVDTSGVALAAIQGLNQKLMEKNAQLEQRIAELEQLVQALVEK